MGTSATFEEDAERDRTLTAKAVCLHGHSLPGPPHDSVRREDVSIRANSAEFVRDPLTHHHGGRGERAATRASALAWHQGPPRGAAQQLWAPHEEQPGASSERTKPARSGVVGDWPGGRRAGPAQAVGLAASARPGAAGGPLCGFAAVAAAGGDGARHARGRCPHAIRVHRQ